MAVFDLFTVRIRIVSPFHRSRSPTVKCNNAHAYIFSIRCDSRGTRPSATHDWQLQTRDLDDFLASYGGMLAGHGTARDSQAPLLDRSSSGERSACLRSALCPLGTRSRRQQSSARATHCTQLPPSSFHQTPSTTVSREIGRAHV